MGGLGNLAREIANEAVVVQQVPTRRLLRLVAQREVGKCGEPRLSATPGCRPGAAYSLGERAGVRSLRATCGPAGSPCDNTFDGLLVRAAEEDGDALIMSRRRARGGRVGSERLAASYAVHHIEGIVELAASPTEVPIGDLVVVRAPTGG